MRTALLDSDIIAYEFASKSERRYDFGDGMVRVADDIEEVAERIDRRIATIKRETKSQDVIVCLSDPRNRYWRHDVLPSYKAARAGIIKPENLMPLKTYLANQYRSFVRPGLEADDIMGILATHPHLVPGEKVIVSLDKDMGQIPGLWFRPGHGMRRVTAEEGERLHWMQMLTGDPVDGYKGLPGVGPVKAAAILTDADVLGSPWAAVVAAYEQRGLASDDALVQARVAKILQWTDYDYKAKEVKLWNPPQ